MEKYTETVYEIKLKNNTTGHECNHLQTFDKEYAQAWCEDWNEKVGEYSTAWVIEKTRSFTVD